MADSNVIYSKEVNDDEKKKYVKKYKCPYCEKRLPRTKLADHIEKEHEDLIPKGYTSNRVAFNTINKKEHGTCVICGKESPWNEDKCRYERLCGNSKCKKIYIDRAEQNTHRHADMRDPKKNIAKTMVDARRSSKRYKFSDGGMVLCNSEYELELLKFLDKTMHFKSSDIVTDLVIPYKYHGEQSRYYPDFYIPTYNLIIEVKDGGDNVNKAITDDVRERTRLKEEEVIKHYNYNYIRLTNRNHAQLLEALMNIKYSYLEGEEKRFIKINEAMNAMMTSMHVQNQPKPIYIVNHMMNNVFSGEEPERKHALCGKYMSDIITFSDGVFKKMDLEEFSDLAYNIEVYEYLGDSDEDVIDILKECDSDKDFYTVLTGKELLDYNQIRYDPLFRKVKPFTETLSMIESCILASADNMVSEEIHGVEIPTFPIFENGTIKTNGDLVEFYRGIDGVYAKNKITGMSTPCYESVYDIPDDFINFINNI